MGTFMPRVSAAVATPNPSRHVNYTLGMVLGVDEFTQEFAYLSGRDQWLARDLIGYGTVSGLKVRSEKDDKGPRVLVEPGAALSPRGQLIRVTPAQCAYLNPWLAANKEKLSTPAGSPLDEELHLYVVLCYRDCATEMTPVPGEPCRSEEELMAASRLADDFRLELRIDGPPEQLEERAVRDFVDWLSQVELSDTSTTTLDDFLKAVRNAAHLLGPLDSPLSSPLSPPEDFMFGSPPIELNIPSASACEFLRAAFRVWVTELRPLWRPNWFSEWQCCDQKETHEEKPKEECLLLAELDVPLHRVALSDEIKVDDLREVKVMEDRRPFLVHSRLLQEWLLCGRVHEMDATPAALSGPNVVAAGSFRANGTAVFAFGGLRATRNSTDPSVYLLTGAWFSSGANFIVKGTPAGDLRNTGGQTFEVIATVPGLAAGDRRRVVQDAFGPDLANGIMVRILTARVDDRPIGEFSVEISRF
jgi:hypothetical protein